MRQGKSLFGRPRHTPKTHATTAVVQKQTVLQFRWSQGLEQLTEYGFWAMDFFWLHTDNEKLQVGKALLKMGGSTNSTPRFSNMPNSQNSFCPAPPCCLRSPRAVVQGQLDGLLSVLLSVSERAASR